MPLLLFAFISLKAISSLDFFWLEKTDTTVRVHCKSKVAECELSKIGDPCPWPQHFGGVENKAERISSLPWTLVAIRYGGKT